jgi:putative flippase GtrA
VEAPVRSLIRRKLVRYLLAGGVTAGLEYISFLALYAALQPGLVVPNTLSFLVGLLSSFTLNRLWVFDHKQHKRVHHQFVQYGILICLNLLVTNLVIVGCRQLDIEPFIGKIVAMAVTTAWNFAIYKYVIFKQHEPAAD